MVIIRKVLAVLMIVVMAVTIAPYAQAGFVAFADNDAVQAADETVPQEEEILMTEESDPDLEEAEMPAEEMEPPTEDVSSEVDTHTQDTTAAPEENTVQPFAADQIASNATVKTTLGDVVTEFNKPYKKSIKDTVTVSPAWGRTVELYLYDKYHEKWVKKKTYKTANKKSASVTITYPSVWKAYSGSTWKISCPKYEADNCVCAKASKKVKIKNKIANAKAAIVMDAKTGEVLYAQNARDHLKIASMTKMVTMMVVVDNVKMDKKVKITKEAVTARKKSGGMGLKKGDKVRMIHLVHATLMESANDAAAAAACGVSGSQGKFAKLMKKKAKSLGATESTYKYAYGDWHSETYSTAYDQALIGREFMTNPNYSTLRKIVKKKSYTFKTSKKKIKYTVKMGGMSKSLIAKGRSIGIKSGYNPPAGYCYANAWKHKDKTYISIVMGASSDKKLVSSQKALMKFGDYSVDHKVSRITVK